MLTRTIVALCLLIIQPAAMTSSGAGIQVEQPTAYLGVPVAGTMSVYATIKSGHRDLLKSVASPQAATAIIYLTLTKGGKSSRSPAHDGLIVAPEQPIVMSANGSQIILSGLTGPFTAGDTLQLQLDFARAGIVSVTVPIKAAGADHVPP